MTLSIQGLNRVKHENPYNYSDEQLALKDQYLRQIKLLWPDANSYYAELALDLCLTKSEEEQREIMKRIDSTESKHKIPEILTSNTLQILDNSDNLAIN
jgi:hypothetical protein